MRAQQAIARQLAADIEKRIVEAVMPRGSHCSESTCSVISDAEIDSALAITEGDIIAAMKLLAVMPKPVIAVVCRPDTVGAVRQLVAQEPPSILGPLPVYEKRDQVAPYLAFYDHDTLRAHLETRDELAARNRLNSPNTKGSREVR
jgi:hypothetical protein